MDITIMNFKPAWWAGALFLYGSALGAMAQAAGPFYGSYIYFFTGGSDGGEPKAGLVRGSDGNLYGATSKGGSGYGTVFKISPSAPHELTTLWTFTGGSDGGAPLAGLAEGIDGSFYGTTSQGGNGYGTVFKISPTAPYSLTTLWPFTGQADGGVPVAGLLRAWDDAFYGTTSKGGNGYGTVFWFNPLSPPYSVHTAWSFSGGSDGGEPMAGLMQPGGLVFNSPIYGATYSGGNGYGTIFQLAPGALTTVWTFSGGSDGGQPKAGLAVGSDGNLYGTTTEGGETLLNPAGTVFQINTNAPFNITTLASFDQTDLDGDGGGLVQGSDGNFYGILNLAFNRYGGVFQLDPAAPINQNLSVLWQFTSVGSSPYGGLVQGSDGNFYGTTSAGSVPGGAAGSVFELLPPSPATQLQILLPGQTATPGVAPGKTGTPNPQMAGAPFTVTVNALDANFNLVTTGWRELVFVSSDAQAVLPGEVALLGGTGTFSVTLNTPGTQTLTAEALTQGWASAPALSPVSDQVLVNAPGLKLFVSEYGAASIEEVAYVPDTSAWAVSVYASGASLTTPAGLAFDNFGDLVVANMETNPIAQVTAGGDLGYWPVLSGPLGGYGSFYGHAGLAFDPKGNLYVANLVDLQHAGTPFNQDSGNSISEFQPVPPAPAVPATYNGSTIASGLTGVRGLALDSHGNIFVADFDDNKIWELTYNSGASAWDVSTLDVASGPAFDGPYGLAFDTAGKLYVANYNGNTISMVTFGPGGAATASTFAANPAGSPDSPLNQPAGLAFDTYGTLYVANFGDSTIAEVSTDGAVSTLVSTGLTQPAFVVATTPPAGLPVANIIWTNTAGGNWSNPDNWSPNRVPGLLNSGASKDDVAIAAPGTYTVVLDEGAAPGYWGVHTLALGASFGGQGVQTLAVVNKTLVAASLAVFGGGQLNSDGSTYTNNPFTVIAGGTVNSTNDTFHLALAVGSGGQLAANNLTIDSDCWLTVKGTLGVVEESYLNLYGPATNSGAINAVNGGISIVNEGTSYYQGSLLNLPGATITLSGGEGIQGQGSNQQFINQGSVVTTNSYISVANFNNQAGTVTNWPGTLIIYQASGTLAGTYYAPSGASVYFNQLSPGVAGPLLPGVPLVLAGAGQYQFRSGFLFLPTNTVPNLVLSGGTLALGANFQGGTIQDLALDGIELTNRLLVTGTLAATNSPIDGNVLVAKGGQFTADNVTINGDCWLTVNGALGVVGGSYLNLYGPATNSGSINAVNGGISIVNEGTSSYQGSLLNLPGATITLSGGEGIQGQGSNDQFINQGAVLGANSAINVTSFTNFGTLTAQSGTLNLNTVTLEPAGALSVELNGENDYGQFSISGNAVLTGVFGIEPSAGFVPAPGEQFLVLSYGSYSGQFTSYSGPPTPCWSGAPGPTGFMVTVVSCSSPGHWFEAPVPALTRSGDVIMLSWPSMSGWTLEHSSALGLEAVWSPVTGSVTDNGTNYLIVTPREGNLFFKWTSP